MEAIKIEVAGNIARVIEKPLRITSGTVGLPVEFTFDSQWEGLSKIAVFQAGYVRKDMEVVDDATVVPMEITVKPNVRLNIGVYGVNEDSSVAIPTIWANAGQIRDGAVPGGSTGSDIGIAKKYYDEAMQAAKNADASAKKAESEAGVAETNADRAEASAKEADVARSNAQVFANDAGEANRQAEEAADRAEEAAKRAEAGSGASIIVAVDEGNVATHNAAEIYDAIENKQTVVYRHDDRLGSEFISLKTATPDVAVFSKTGYPTEFDIFNIEIDSNGTVNYQTSSGSTLVQQAVEKVETDTAPVSYLPQDPAPEQQAQARENIGLINNQNIHSHYFVITEDGVLSLKPEYRGACYGAIEFVPGMDVTKGYFYVDKLGSGSKLYQCVKTSGSSAVKEHGYPQKLTDTYYFSTVTGYEDKVSDNGAGVAGSKNYELPTLLYVPETVGIIASNALAPMAFDHNHAIKQIVFPTTVTSVLEQCFFGCQNLESVHNTEHITSIGRLSFSRCIALKQVYLPSLETTEEQSFRSCVLLEYAHIGKVTELANELFRGCYKLKEVEHDSSCKVISVGNGAFEATYELREAIFIKDVTYMGIGAFFKSGINYDWGSLTECKFAEKTTANDKVYETYPTSLQLNPVDFWSDCTPSACHNPTPTHLCQLDPRWITRWVGNIEESGKAYGNGCGLFTFIHAYCGLNNLELSNVAEFESIVNKMLDNDPSIWTDYRTLVAGGDGMKEWGERLGLSVTEYCEYNTSTLQKLYDALLDGSYAYAVIPTYTTQRGTLEVNSGGHAALIYGATEDGRLMVLDSNELYPEDMTVGRKYSALYQSSFYPTSNGSSDPQFCIISKPIKYTRYATIEDALAETNEVADGVVGAYYDKYGKYHVALLGNMESATKIGIQRDCTFHLNGYTLNFTAPDAYLDMSIAKLVTIDGTVTRKETQSDGKVVFHKGTIQKDGVTNTSSSEHLVKTTGTNLTVYGGVYSLTNIDAQADRKGLRVFAAGVSDPVAKIILNDCSIHGTGIGSTGVIGIQADSVVVNNCEITTESVDDASACMSIYLDIVVKNSTLTATSTGQGMARCVDTKSGCSKCDIMDTHMYATVDGYNGNNNAVGVYIDGLNANITDCDIVVNRIGESDYREEPKTLAIDFIRGGTVTLSGTNTFVPAYP